MTAREPYPEALVIHRLARMHREADEALDDEDEDRQMILEKLVDQMGGLILDIQLRMPTAEPY